MNEEMENLSEISTRWTLFFQSVDAPNDEMQEARRRLLDRYSTPVFRYLAASVGNRDVAEELYQEFALRFVRGDFRRAHPDRGRFRHYLKRALRNLITDHYRRRQSVSPLAQDVAAPVEDAPAIESDREYLASWRAKLLSATWTALKQHEKESGKPLYTVLRLRTEQPELNSEQMAKHLSSTLQQQISAGWVRKRLHYAREKFTELLIQEVLQTLENPTRDELEQELEDLGLIEYCRAGLERF